jgi:hypothetical protein
VCGQIGVHVPCQHAISAWPYPQKPLQIEQACDGGSGQLYVGNFGYMRFLTIYSLYFIFYEVG